MMKKIVIACLLSTAFAAPAFAADQGFYIGANVTNTSNDLAGAKSPTGFTIDGGYQFNKNFAVEAQYADFGNFAPVGSMKDTSLGVVAVGILPFDAQWSGYGRLGLARVDAKLSGTGVLGADGTYTKTGLTYGIGAQYNFTPAWGLRFGVDQYKAGGSQGAFILLDNTLTVLNVGVNYKF